MSEVRSLVGNGGISPIDQRSQLMVDELQEVRCAVPSFLASLNIRYTLDGSRPTPFGHFGSVSWSEIPTPKDAPCEGILPRITDPYQNVAGNLARRLQTMR